MADRVGGHGRRGGDAGVLAVFTGEDFKDVGGNPAGWLIKEPQRRAECASRSARSWRMARCAMLGDAYAAVIAETYAQARDARTGWPRIR